MPLAERMFRATGSDCHVMVATTSEAASNQFGDLAMTRVELLEDCWSRFRPGSELSRLNLRAGSGPVSASEDLFALVHHMKTAWAATEGGSTQPS